MKISETLRAIAAHITPFNTPHDMVVFGLITPIDYGHAIIYLDRKSDMICSDSSFYDHNHKIIHFLLIADIAESEGK